MTRIALVGGFLGAGKTTLLLEAARRLIDRDYRVGLITNDQGEDLVDTAMGKEASVPVTEVIGGCFCCRFPDLLTSLQHLQKIADPHVILAEPVGSCTDLVSTVLRPLVQFYGEQFELAPLTVLLDFQCSIDEFPPDVHYLYQQQLAEAELILLSKSELTTDNELKAQLNSYQSEFPSAHLMSVSAKSGDRLDEWLDVILGQASANPEALLIDYERYAEAEAALGWLNVKGQVRSDRTYSMRQWITDLLGELRDQCRQNNCPIAHVKTLVSNRCEASVLPKTISPESDSRFKASLTNVTSAIAWDLEHGPESTTAHDFTLNARINTTPRLLELMSMQAVERAKPTNRSRYYIEHFECFSPLAPEPTHRL